MDSADSDQPENIRKLYLKALSAKEFRNYGYAISLLEAVVKAEPEFDEASSLLKELLNELDD